METHEQGGAYFEAQLPDGSSVSGTAHDEAHARRVIEALQDGTGHPCHHCAQVVVYDDAARRWTHKYSDAGVRCYPEKLRPTAWPAPPTSRDRPACRGVWGVDSSRCHPSAGEPEAGKDHADGGPAEEAEHDVALPQVQPHRDRECDGGTVGRRG